MPQGEEEKIKTTYEWSMFKPVDLYETYFESYMGRLDFDETLCAIKMKCISSGENPLPLIQKWIDKLPRDKDERKTTQT